MTDQDYRLHEGDMMNLGDSLEPKPKMGILPIVLGSVSALLVIAYLAEVIAQ